MPVDTDALKAAIAANKNEPELDVLKKIEESGEPTKKKKLLEEALEIVYGARLEEYGAAEKNISDIAAIWSVILGVQVTNEQVCLAMIGVKMARLMKTPNHRDSWIDIAGYVQVKDKCDRGE